MWRFPGRLDRHAVSVSPELSSATVGSRAISFVRDCVCVWPYAPPARRTASSTRVSLTWLKSTLRPCSQAIAASPFALTDKDANRESFWPGPDTRVGAFHRPVIASRVAVMIMP
jgi:hypothetical protein